MSVAVIQNRLLAYNSQTIPEQDHALKEIAQEIALSGLARAGFFRVAAFQGGTSLRILYGLDRFSEDLDFVLENPDKHFTWTDYLNNMKDEFNAYGFSLEVSDKTKLDRTVQTAFLKTDSIGGLLIIRDSDTQHTKLKIKLEIDTNPPAGSCYELKYLDFPLPFSIKTQDLPSLFASKSHALLCSPYVKGRDWYDFIWYVARKTPINFTLLNHALDQAGPWQGQNIEVTPHWLINALTNTIDSIDWNAAKKDVARFLRARERETINLWSKDFFLSRVEKLDGILAQTDQQP